MNNLGHDAICAQDDLDVTDSAAVGFGLAVGTANVVEVWTAPARVDLGLIVGAERHTSGWDDEASVGASVWTPEA